MSELGSSNLSNDRHQLLHSRHWLLFGRQLRRFGDCVLKSIAILWQREGLDRVVDDQLGTVNLWRRVKKKLFKTIRTVIAGGGALAIFLFSVPRDRDRSKYPVAP